LVYVCQTNPLLVPYEVIPTYVVVVGAYSGLN
jgi:hypothetical protein